MGVGCKVFVVPGTVYHADATTLERTLLLFLTGGGLAAGVFMRHPVIPAPTPNLGTQAPRTHGTRMPPCLEVLPPLH